MNARARAGSKVSDENTPGNPGQYTLSSRHDREDPDLA